MDDEDNEIEVLYESSIYNTPGSISIFDQEWYEVLMKYNQIYNFSDLESVSPMEFQARRKSTGDKWWYMSNPIDDYMNL